MDAKRTEKNLRNSSFIIGGAGYKALHEELDNNLINELSLLDINNDQAKIGIVYKLFFALIMDDYSLSQIVCAIKNTFRDYNKNITKEEVFDLLKACINESYNSIASMNNQNIPLQQPVQQNPQPAVAPQPQQNPQPNPSEVNMNLGFDITRFINSQSQPKQVQQYPNMGYIHQQQQQQQDEQRKIYVKNMINVISSHIDTSKCKINLKDIYAENLIDVTALYYMITDPEVQFQLTNRGIAPGAKFINIQSDDQSFEYKFEVGGRNVYLSTRHMVDSNNNIHFVYKID